MAPRTMLFKRLHWLVMAVGSIHRLLNGSLDNGGLGLRIRLHTKSLDEETSRARISLRRQLHSVLH
jgi:hypothetical protein